MNTTPIKQQELIFQNMAKAKQMGIAHVSVDEVIHPGRLVQIKDRELVNFSSCSYMGLETDQRLKDGAIELINNYGVAFSASRAYVGVEPFNELENLMQQIFGYPTLVMPSTTMSHLSILPLLVGKNDAVILDHQVHASVQFSVKLASADGVHVEMVRHNNVEYLENRIKKLSGQYNKIWYMADGVYSMYGDTAPMKELYRLMDDHDQFHLYIDDAHGMSWTGKNGAGFVLSEIPYHEKMMLVTSLYKGFGTGGAAIVCRDEKMKTFVKSCGGTFIFSGPMKPATIGSAIASAKIHLTSEIKELQLKLKKRIEYFKTKALSLGLPVVSDGKTPIFFIGVGKIEVGYSMCQRLLDAGFLGGIAAYPSVPMANTGIRVMVNNHHSYEDIDNLLATTANLFHDELSKESYGLETIFRAFRMRGTVNTSLS
ncbi:MAG: aminotransferase class I/II-fold pyridoxal phosphate-dependent enzyme [Bacteroidota bacterium]